MKKKNSFYFFIVFALIAVPQVFGATIGDVNNDTVINIVDALITAQYAVGINPASFNQLVADVDGNNAINILDALIIAQYSVGVISIFPVNNNILDAKYKVILVPLIDETVLPR